MTKTWKEFGELIREARVRNGLSQNALAEYVGKKAATISRWENGERRPKQGSILVLSQVLGIKIQILQKKAGYTPEFDWYASFTAKVDTKEDILSSATKDEKESLRKYLHYIRFSEQITRSYKS
jgi:transcriptional regulator with XRE-family HTH domain